MRELDEIFAALQHSAFRRRIHLNARDLQYLRNRGLPMVMEHAEQFIAQRLAPADPPNDGRQTPWRGHPAFVAQHATATCCRKCLAKWHGISAGRALSPDEVRHVLTAIEWWLVGAGGYRPHP